MFTNNPNRPFLVQTSSTSGPLCWNNVQDFPTREEAKDAVNLYAGNEVPGRTVFRVIRKPAEETNMICGYCKLTLNDDHSCNGCGAPSWQSVRAHHHSQIWKNDGTLRNAIPAEDQIPVEETNMTGSETLAELIGINENTQWVPERTCVEVCDPRDTNAYGPICSECKTDRVYFEEWGLNPGIEICCHPADTANDGEIAELAQEYDASFYVGPMSDKELTDAINTEIFGIPQPNTQTLVRCETMHGKPIPGIWPIETFMQRGFVIDAKSDDTELTPAWMILKRPYSPVDADWLIAYSAQGGGI